MLEDQPTRSATLIRRLDQKLSDSQREILINWANRMLAIRSSSLSSAAKAKKAVEETWKEVEIVPLIRLVADTAKQHGWSERSWAVRLGLGTAAVAAVTFAGKGAGIAALGGAIGLPLWIVLGAGGAFAGVLVDELQRTLSSSRSIKQKEHGDSLIHVEEEIPEGEWAEIAEAVESGTDGPGIVPPVG